MKFFTTTIKGHGRGRGLGYPTINMVVPKSIPDTFVDGIYSAHIKLNDKEYKGAFFYGPIPAFGQSQKVFEVFLLDTTDIEVREGEPIEIEAVDFVRRVMKFDQPDQLVLQIEKDVATIKGMLTMDK